MPISDCWMSQCCSPVLLYPTFNALLCHLVHHRVAKEPPRVGKEHYLLKPFGKMLRGCFSPLSGFKLSVSLSLLQQCHFLSSFFLPPHFPSPHRLTCAPVRSSHYFTWQGGFKSVLLSLWPHCSMLLTKVFHF